MIPSNKQGMQSEASEEEYVQSLLNILDRELAAAMAMSNSENASSEIDLMVADMLGYLTADKKLKIEKRPMQSVTV
jgi:hypothetical protein